MPRRLWAWCETTKDHMTRASGAEIEEFAAAALAFLEANARRRPPAESAPWGAGPDRIGIVESHASPADEQRFLREARAWRRRVFDAGFGWVGGPPEYGGGGRDPILDSVYESLERGFDVPNQGPFSSATHLIAPSILRFGSHDLKVRYLRGLFRGDLLACQLLSEPEAGSDLAALRSTARRDGREWVVRGQKVWSSYAHVADVGQLLVRTDPEAPKHAGLTMFLVEMDRPGIEVRPIRQMTGEAHFNEVFLDDVHVPNANRVGEPGEGWRAIMATLASERAAVGSGRPTGADAFQRLVQLVRHFGAADRSPVLRDVFADAWIHEQVLRYLALRYEHRQASGDEPACEPMIMKLHFARQATRIADIAARVLGPALAADTGEWGTFAWTRWVSGAPGLRIAGGTDEIQRNVLAERVLGLPRSTT